MEFSIGGKQFFLEINYASINCTVATVESSRSKKYFCRKEQKKKKEENEVKMQHWEFVMDNIWICVVVYESNFFWPNNHEKAGNGFFVEKKSKKKIEEKMKKKNTNYYQSIELLTGTNKQKNSNNYFVSISISTLLT